MKSVPVERLQEHVVNAPQQRASGVRLAANSIYCSCERDFNPSLRDQPVVVLSHNDGSIPRMPAISIPPIPVR